MRMRARLRRASGQSLICDRNGNNLLMIAPAKKQLLFLDGRTNKVPKNEHDEKRKDDENEK